MVKHDISIHRPLAGPDTEQIETARIDNISIHRPLAGPDGGTKVTCRFLYGISIHRPLAGPDDWQGRGLHGKT